MFGAVGSCLGCESVSLRLGGLFTLNRGLTQLSSSHNHVDQPGGGAIVKAQVKWFNASKGFGFVAVSEGDQATKDAFLHISTLQQAGVTTLGQGAEVRCEIESGTKGLQVTRVVEILSHGQPESNDRGSYRRSSRYDNEPTANDQLPTVNGTVKWFKPERGFGFITLEDDSPENATDVFIHKSILYRCRIPSLEQGQRVLMKIQQAHRGYEATWIRLA